MEKWKIESVYPPDIMRPSEARIAEEEKLHNLLEQGFETFGLMDDRIWLRMKTKEEPK